MRATIYTTNDHGEYRCKPISYGIPLSGITTIKAAEAPAHTAFLGFGVAITGSSCYNLSQMEPGERRKVLQHLYSKDGLNLQIGRLSIGSSDYSAEVYTYDDGDEDLSLSRFSIERDKEYIIPMIKEILEINPELKLYASPWSPPGWMKSGGNIGGGFMRSKYLNVYADYIVKYVQAYAAEGIKLHAVTHQNEPTTQQLGKMPACIWNPDQEAKFITILRKKFDQNHIDTQIWCCDNGFDSAQIVSWCLQEYPAMKDACTGIGFHYYSGTIEKTAFLKEQYPNLQLHFTEGGPRLTDHYDTDWCKWGLIAIKALNCGYSSFTGWNLMLDETGGPKVGPHPCGGLVTRNSQDHCLSYSGQYKAFRHFSMLDREHCILPLRMERETEIVLKKYPTYQYMFTEGCMAKSADGKVILMLVNPASTLEQLQYYYGGKWWYIELQPNTLATVVLEA